jgi:flagellar hook-associated protein 2
MGLFGCFLIIWLGIIVLTIRRVVQGKWNEKAKTGLLYNDHSVNKVINSVRMAISTASGGMTLSAMGITMTKYSGRSDTGELTIDEDKLEAAIEQYGDEIASFFTDVNTGLGAKLNNAIDEAISTKPNGYGYLTQLAGIENTASAKKNQMYSEMETIQSMIDTLNKRYESEQNRYWTRFTQLETFLSKMDAQSSIFMSG